MAWSARKPGPYYIKWWNKVSYINEALKKAQRDRDAKRIKHFGRMRYTGKDKADKQKKLFGCIILSLLVLGLGFMAYLWLYTPHDQSLGYLENESIESGLQDPKNVTNKRGLQNKPTFEKLNVSTPVSEGITPNTTRLYDRAKDLYQRGRFQDAEKLYKDVLRLDPEFLDALNNLGVVYIRIRNFNEAKECFEKAIQLEPDSVEPYYNLACLHSIKGEVKEGLIQLSRAINLNPSVKDWAEEDPDLLNLRGVPDFKDVIKD